MDALAKTANAHSWKLMTLGAILFGIGFPIALANGRYLLAVAACIGLGVIALQWLTVDPPGVDEDSRGPL
jgi:hypothetical protein